MIDTAPFIYYIEEHQRYLPIIKPIFDQIDSFKFEAITSTITLLEVLVFPKKQNNLYLESQYVEILTQNASIELVDITIEVAQIASEIRAYYDIKTPDALQIASGIANNCDSFLTNDKALKKVKEIKVLVLDELSK